MKIESTSRSATSDDSSRKGRPVRLIGDPDSHDTIQRILRTRPPCKVLDIPSGRGSLTSLLLDLGWDVHCADIDSGLLGIGGVPFESVDLNKALPYEDASFEAIVCANALHRIYNPGGAIREFFRILQPGGRLYINANNFASSGARLRFLIGGSVDTRINEGGAQQTIDLPEANIRFILLYPQIANMLSGAGFEIVDVKTSAVRLRHRLLTPFSWLIHIASYVVPPARRRRDHIQVTASKAILGGRYFVVEASKPIS